MERGGTAILHGVILERFPVGGENLEVVEAVFSTLLIGTPFLSQMGL